jgi:hypothetical protein
LEWLAFVQVEYQFSDTNLVANDFLTKIMNKDPEGYGEGQELNSQDMDYTALNAGTPKKSVNRKLNVCSPFGQFLCL